MTDLAPGTVIHGYRVERLLGAGGMGAVHLAVHDELGRVVALKSMHPQAAASEEFRKRFRREARAAMAVRHPNVVRVHEIFENEGVPYIAMEYLEGESLEERLTRDGAMPIRAACRMMVRVTSAVGTAHAMGIVHRDLKPDNIFLVGGGEDPEVKVLDFGIAKLTAQEGAAAETAALTKTGMLMGTPFYMSPEQAFGDKTIDQRSDIWALGIILYRAVSGILPTRADGFGEVFRLVVKERFRPLAEVAPNAPADVCALVDGMLHKSRDERPWDLREAYAILARHAEAPEAAAPSFGVAVAPLWDEASTATTDPTAAGAPPREPMATTPGGSKPLAMTPGALRLAPGPWSAPGVGPGGTIALSPPSGSAAARVTSADATRTDDGARPGDAGAATLVQTRAELEEAVPAPPRQGLPRWWIPAALAVVAAIAGTVWALR